MMRMPPSAASCHADLGSAGRGIAIIISLHP